MAWIFLHVKKRKKFSDASKPPEKVPPQKLRVRQTQSNPQKWELKEKPEKLNGKYDFIWGQASENTMRFFLRLSSI